MLETSAASGASSLPYNDLAFSNDVCVCTVSDQVFKVLNLSYKVNFDFYPVTADERDGRELVAKRAGVQSEGA